MHQAIYVNGPEKTTYLDVKFDLILRVVVTVYAKITVKSNKTNRFSIAHIEQEIGAMI